uniref:Uncharacterized protein LOC105109968 isoform X1 n=1 Tax=Rhizophora mucronata TaxID=61149 RepID=A0A2P2JEI1_RHIMU
MDPSEDHAMRNIEPSCPTSLLIWAALCCCNSSCVELERVLPEYISCSRELVKDLASFSRTNFHTMISLYMVPEAIRRVSRLSPQNRMEYKRHLSGD